MRLRHGLVTGASAGIGRELVRQLVNRRGMKVIATARREDRLNALAAELPAGQVIAIAGDLADPDFRGRLWERAEALDGGLDLLVNNAAFGHYKIFSNEDFRLIQEMFDVNVMALMDLTGRAVRHMEQRGGGQVVQISSTLGFLGLPGSATYCATKHAVQGLVKSLRYELRGSGVRVWAACPGRTESEFQAVALGQSGETRRARFSEPTERVVRGILTGLDRDRAFVYPTWSAWATVKLASWLPGPFDWAMRRYALGLVRDELDSSGT